MRLPEALRLVRGAVSTKDLVTVLTHLAIKDASVTSFDGAMSIMAPCDDIGHLSCTVPADRFIAAIDACESATPTITLVDGALHVTATRVAIKMPTGDIAAFPFADSLSVKMRVMPHLLDVLRELRPFVGNDASRPWASGILFRENVAAATNNTIVALKTLPSKVPQEFILPLFAVDELLRIGQEPKVYALDGNNVAFYLERGAVLKSRLIDGAWPRSSVALVQELSEGAAFGPVPDGLAKGIETLLPFVADLKTPIIEFADTLVRTLDADVQGTLSGFSNLGKCRFRAEPLITTLHSAVYADFSRFPRVPWRNSDASLCGVLVGMLL